MSNVWVANGESYIDLPDTIGNVNQTSLSFEFTNLVWLKGTKPSCLFSSVLFKLYRNPKNLFLRVDDTLINLGLFSDVFGVDDLVANKLSININPFSSILDIHLGSKRLYTYPSSLPELSEELAHYSRYPTSGLDLVLGLDMAAGCEIGDVKIAINNIQTRNYVMPNSGDVVTESLLGKHGKLMRATDLPNWRKLPPTRARNAYRNDNADKTQLSI